ncbi:MAG: restriction endonuclease subunit S [Acidobacteriota bacterium]|nr:restriction endonuclease subunit S [Acidobacteriota bacterium]
MSEQNQLPYPPAGWVQTNLGEITEPGRERVNPHSFSELPYIGLEHIEAHTMRLLGTVPSRSMSSSAVHFYPNDVLYARLRPYLNKVYRPNFEGLCSGEFIVFPSSSYLSSKFLQYLLNSSSVVNFASHSVTGDRPRIDFDQLSRFQVLLPPLAEQQRVVDEIEKQFSHLDAAIEILQRVERNLERLRTATLKAAVEGQLVPTESDLARAEGRDYEPADVLLQRILRERRAKWEADQLAKMIEQGKTPENDRWKARYKEPMLLDTNNSLILPEGWVWVTLGQLTWSVKDGPHYSPEYVDEGIPFITGGNVRPSGVDFDNAKRISPELHKELSKRVKPEVGDILYTKGGTTGIARVNTYEREFNVWVHVAVLKLAGYVEPFYVQHALNSPQGYAQAQKFTHGVGNQDLGLTRMIDIMFGLPPLAEQQRIVAEIERCISVIEELKTLVTNALRRAAILRQKILRDGFAGKLVLQDPVDESASILLERIRAEKAEREAEANEARKERRGKMKGRKVRAPERKARRPLRETVAESKGRLTPEQLFTEAGFTPEVVEDFYEELRREIKAGHIEQVRPDNTKVYLIAANA